MCCNIDKYLFEGDEEFYYKNESFLKKTLFILYLIAFVNILLFIYVIKYVL